MAISTTGAGLANVEATLATSATGQTVINAVSSLAANVTVQYGTLAQSGGGFDFSTNTITIDPSLSYSQQVLALAHELTHAEDYNTDPVAMWLH
jgi:hypothetical protein